MAHMICQIHAYDVMGEVFISAVVTDHDEAQGSESRQTAWTTTFPGTGEDRQPRWLRDVLQGLLEAL